MRWKFKKWISLYPLLFFLVLGLGITSYFLITREEPPITTIEVTVEPELTIELEQDEANREGLEEFQEALRPKRIEIDIAIPAIYIIIFSLPLVLILYVIGSVIQAISSSSLSIRGNSNADLAKARTIRAKRQQEARCSLDD